MHNSTDSTKLAVILINWNNEEDTAECLDSLKRQSISNFKTIVVDNGSNQTSYDYLRKNYEWPEYIRNEENLGFTGGNNAGIHHALKMGAEYVLLLNNDTKVDDEFLDNLLDHADQLPDSVGVIGPKVHTYDEHRLWSAGGQINFATGVTEHRDGTEEQYSQSEPVDYVVGAAMLVRSEVFRDIGLLDDDFFIYYEETEFCVRAQKRGWEVWYVPIEGVYHKEGIDFEHSPFREYYFTRNRVLFERKTQPTLTFALFAVYFLVRWVFLQTGYLLADNQPVAARETVRGAIDSFIGTTGKNH